MFKKSIILAGTFLLLSSISFAEVDIKSGTYSIRRADQALDSEFSGFKITRTYSSTVDFEGLFGFGWCSDLETSLTVTAKGQITLVDCGAGEHKVYNSQEFVSANTAEAVALLGKKMQAAGQELIPAERDAVLKSRVRRTDFISKYGVKFDISKSPYFLNPFPNEEQIIYKDNKFVRKTAGGLEQHFDSNGRLILQKHHRGDVIKFSYDKNGLKSIESQRGQTVTFKINEAGHVEEMRGQQEATKYTYSADGQLLKVSQKDGDETYAYQDDLLTSIEGRESIKIKYNPVTRFVASVTKGSCTEDYNYTIDKGALKFKMDYKAACKDSKAEKITYDFQYQKGADGSIYQKRMVATDGKGGLSTAEYAEEGKPTRIIRSGVEFKFGYDEQGRIISKETAKQRIEYAYGSSGKVVSARITQLGKRTPASEMQQFNYDEKTRLTSVIYKTDTIKYSYDKKDRLTKIESKMGPVFTIANDGLTGKTTRIAAQGIGHFEMKYSVDGKMVKNEWKGDIEKALAVLDRYELLRTPYEQSLEFGVPK